MLEPTVEPRPAEGPVARAIEKQTSRLPSDLFLWVALGFIGISAAMQAVSHRENKGLFIAQLAPTLLLMGLYNKLVKVAGSDQYDQPQPHFGH